MFPNNKEFNLSGSGVFYEPIENDYLLHTPKTLNKFHPEHQIIHYCPGKIIDLEIIEVYETNELKVTCRSGGQWDGNCPRGPCRNFKCNNFQFFILHRGTIKNCGHKGYVYTGTIKGIRVTLMEICFDPINSHIIFFHFVASTRSQLVKEQQRYAESLMQTKFEGTSETVREVLDVGKIEVENNSSLLLPNSKAIIANIQYEIDTLVNKRLLYPAVTHLIEDQTFNFITATPWWTPLKTQNWRSFQNMLEMEILKKRNQKHFEIYSGISHSVQIPTSFFFNSDGEAVIKDSELTYNYNERTIPLYIWNYIKPIIENIEGRDFVVIALNTPFVENNGVDNSTIFCEDICDQIEWLKPLTAARKFPGLGLIFCCKPEDVFSTLDGFPSLQ